MTEAARATSAGYEVGHIAITAVSDGQRTAAVAEGSVLKRSP